MRAVILSGILLFSILSTAQVKLPALIRDSMVLQKDTKLKIWGWASAGEKVEVKFQNKTFKTTAGTSGKWMIDLPPQKAGGPYTMNINASNRTTIKDILIGDVWLCSGQSNMVHQMSLHSERYAADIVHANYPQIRQFWVRNTTNLAEPQNNLLNSYWKWANPEDVLQFSAVAYFFAKKIYEKYNVPIGIINASWGGTPIEAWMSEEGLKEFSTVINTVQKNKDTAYVNSTNRTSAASNAARPKPIDKGLTGEKPWYDTSYISKGWRTVTVPGYWEDQGIRNLDGIVWYRRKINVSASMTGIPVKIALGRIIDADFVYVNGKLVGNTTYQYPQRRYQVSAGVLKPGKNYLVVRVINNGGKGGFVPDKPYYIAAGKDTIDLKGDWQYKVGDAFIPYSSSVAGISLQNQPTALFNAMIAPLTNFAIKGILWYQGESNISNAVDYQKLLTALIKDWRSQWKQGDVPFLYVQLPNYDDVQYLPSESPWAVLREGQRKTLSVPNTEMAVTIDVGEWNDIHPDRKKEVGERLAYGAMKLVYADKKSPSSPLLQSAKADGNKVILSFSNVGSGLTIKDGEELSQFAIAGPDKKFVWAKAKIVPGTSYGEGDKVIVWNDDVPTPMYIRYAWADNPDGANLYNKEGLSASPFQAEVKRD